MSLKRTLARTRAGARNALEIVRFGRLAAPYGGSYQIVHEGKNHRLRRYGDLASPESVVLLIPPLMVTADVYDIAPDVSAASLLASRGIAPFVVDFGAPEREEGGMRRTLDDHVRAVSACIDAIRETTGRDVHLCGYSQGGMFAYQTAALRRGDGVASVVTFGSPVDLHRGLPNVRRDVTGAIVELVEPALSSIAARIEGLPGALTSTGFKLLSGRKEIQQRIEFLRTLHDRSALVRREARRKFLGGEGFVAWPGPALRVFLDDFIVHNRMLSGGFVIDGRTVTLADIDKPILAFVGSTDDIARPETVRAIVDAAPRAEVSMVTVRAGHFGLVVGSHAMVQTWPIVAEWILWRDGRAEEPAALRAPAPSVHAIDADAGAPSESDLELLLDAATKSARAAWTRLGDVAAEASDALDAIRYQEPRLRKLARIAPETKLSAALELAERAAESPDATFFLWNGRAFSYRDADVRVTHVMRGLFACGVRPGERVLVVMGSRPSFLSMTTALSRLGAVAVIAPPDASASALRVAAEREDVRHVASDPENAARVHAALERSVLVLGGGGSSRTLAHGLVDMEAIDPAAVELPHDFVPNAGLARDLALVFLRPSNDVELRAAPVTNHRYALSALGAAAACTIKPSDTVFCCIPLHHPTSLMASVGSALASGARLALAERFDPDRFESEIRRTGATLVFYAGDMLRPLLRRNLGRSLPLRLFAGSGMRGDLARKLGERLGVRTMEFYAGTTHRAILANVDGKKPGALGRVLPGSDPIDVARVDLSKKTAVRDGDGNVVFAETGHQGLLAIRADDEWVVTGDVVRRDEDGDYWFVDSLSGFVGEVSTRAIEDTFYEELDVDVAAAYGVRGEVWLAYVGDVAPERVEAALAERDQPRVAVRVDSSPLTEGFRPKKSELPRTRSDPRVLRYQRR
ncbi:MAG TPA: AMP-binding protein [Polyangiaceae bacterium]|jgi:putative long chain acyl-CoA synthase